MVRPLMAERRVAFRTVCDGTLISRSSMRKFAASIRRQKLLDVVLWQNRRHELGCDISFEKTVPVLGELRVIPDGIVNTMSHGSVEQEVKLPRFRQLALRADPCDVPPSTCKAEALRPAVGSARECELRGCDLALMESHIPTSLMTAASR